MRTISEEILGRLIAGHREELVIATKCFNPTGADINARGSSRRHITRAIEGSLKRLHTDRVDVLFMHQFDSRTPLEEIMRGLEDLVQSGKVLYPAVSNYSAWQTQKALGIQALNQYARLQVIEPMYNLVKRQAEVEILPMALDNELAVIPYSPIAGGLLSGKYAAGAGTNEGRLRTNAMYERRYGESWAHQTAADFGVFCQERGLHPVSAAVAWVGTHPAVTAPIIGARSVEQLMPSLGAVKLDMTNELRNEISALSRMPPPATDRLETQQS